MASTRASSLPTEVGSSREIKVGTGVGEGDGEGLGDGEGELETLGVGLAGLVEVGSV